MAIEYGGVNDLGVAARLFQAFSDPSRLTILGHLLLGEHNVAELVEHLDLAQSTVSKHLACLKGCGLVTSRASGGFSYFAVAHPQATAELLGSAEHLLLLTGSAVTLCPTQIDQDA
ncbi:MAG: ArsR/SmtB family transcription factor [Cellulomonadaceae bacterium]